MTMHVTTLATLPGCGFELGESRLDPSSLISQLLWRVGMCSYPAIITEAAELDVANSRKNKNRNIRGMATVRQRSQQHPFGMRSDALL